MRRVWGVILLSKIDIIEIFLTIRGGHVLVNYLSIPRISRVAKLCLCRLFRHSTLGKFNLRGLFRNWQQGSGMVELTIQSLGRPAELLLVEDNYGDVLLTREAFRSAKVSNNHQRSPAMARRPCACCAVRAPYGEQTRPDLILLDLNLPRLDGRRSAARDQSPTPRLAARSR